MTPYTTNIFVPLYILPNRNLDLNKCQVLPGVFLEKISIEQLSIIERIHDMTKIPMTFGPNYLLNIYINNYRTAIIDELINEGRKLEDITDGVTDDFNMNTRLVLASDISKQVIISLFIIHSCHIIMGGDYDIKIDADNPEKYRAESGNVVKRLEIRPHYGSSNRVDCTELSQLAKNLNRYYRPTYWHADRLSFALNSFWSAICSPYPEQSFISMITAIEALLSTDNIGISHKIAERVASVLHKDSDERYKIYQRLKKIYDTRSKLVHGSVKTPKGIINRESLHIDAKKSIVPESMQIELTNMTRTLIREITRNETLLKIIQQGSSEDKMNKQLNDFFMKCLLNIL